MGPTFLLNPRTLMGEKTLNIFNISTERSTSSDHCIQHDSTYSTFQQTEAREICRLHKMRVSRCSFLIPVFFCRNTQKSQKVAKIVCNFFLSPLFCFVFFLGGGGGELVLTPNYGHQFRSVSIDDVYVGRVALVSNF